MIVEALGAHGVHLGDASVTARTPRDWLPNNVHLSRAWHHAEGPRRTNETSCRVRA
jgi:thiamine monophosphate synthase